MSSVNDVPDPRAPGNYEVLVEMYNKESDDGRKAALFEAMEVAKRVKLIDPVTSSEPVVAYKKLDLDALDF